MESAGARVAAWWPFQEEQDSLRFQPKEARNTLWEQGTPLSMAQLVNDDINVPSKYAFFICDPKPQTLNPTLYQPLTLQSCKPLPEPSVSLTA